MKKICYVIPYFGNLPNSFELWLLSCECNKSIDWLLITDDTTNYEFPSNVTVKYMTFEEIVNRIKKFYDFEIVIDRPWKLCEYKEAYGEIFEEELKGYEFWGHCDMDLIWGDIRKFVTDEILDKYEKIGFQGHSTLYKNEKEVNSRYKTIIDGKMNYIDAFSSRERILF